MPGINYLYKCVTYSHLKVQSLLTATELMRHNGTLYSLLLAHVGHYVSTNCADMTAH